MAFCSYLDRPLYGRGQGIEAAVRGSIEPPPSEPVGKSRIEQEEEDDV